MNPNRWTLAGLLGGLAGLWWLAGPGAAAPAGLLAWRSALIAGTGLLALGAMSVALMLATRPVVVEPALGGLDKMYRLHQWLGIGAGVAAVLHWALVQAPHWATSLGLYTRPARGPHAQPEDLLAQTLQSLRGAAEGIGEWAFYAAALLILLALLPRFPYHLFFKTHRLLAVAFGLLVFHGVVLMPAPYWSALVAPVMVLLMAGGSAAAVVTLARRVGRQRRAVAVVSAVTQHPASGVLDITVQLHSRWRGHRAGQFAFVTFDRAEGAHPFTITSAWTGDGQLRFLVKALGDYTRRLPGLVAVGATALVEGPYGRFNFDSGRERQVWVGGGIGITPFVARLRQLAAFPDGRAVDLFYSTTLLDEASVGALRADALAAGVQLHVMVDASDGRLDAGRLRQAVPDWAAGSVWFCGPAAFGRSLRHDLLALGLPSHHFHQELFNLR